MAQPTDVGQHLSLGDVVAAIAALVAAFAGALFAYWFSRRDRAKGESAETRKILATLLPELWQQTDSVFLEIDGVGAAWLGRTHERLAAGARSGAPQAIAIDNRGPLPHRLFDQFFATVVAAELGTYLDAHYQRVKAHNDFLAKHPHECPVDDFREFVQRLCIILDGAVDLSEKIGAAGGGKAALNADNQRLYEHALSMDIPFRFSAALYRTRVEQLEALATGAPVLGDVPAILVQVPPELRRDWIRRVRKGLG